MRLLFLLTICLLASCSQPVGNHRAKRGKEKEQKVVAEEDFAHRELFSSAQKDVRKEKKQKEELLKNSRSHSQWIHCESSYGGFTAEYLLTAPASSVEEAFPLIIVLEESSEGWEPLSHRESWIFQLYSRPVLNFQWIAEREFWEALEKVFALHPQLRAAPKYIIGKGGTTYAALFLANQYRGWFYGAGFSGGEFSFAWTNIATLPVFHFSSDLPDHFPYSGFAYIAWLKEKNRPAQPVAESIYGVIQELFTLFFYQSKEMREKKKELDLPLHRVFCERYGWVTPWLRILEREWEGGLTTLSTRVEENVLYIAGDNIASIEIDCSVMDRLSSSIDTVFFKNHYFPLLRECSIQTFGKEEGEQDNLLSLHRDLWKRKSDELSYGGGWKEFFFHHPIFCVYQDSFLSEENRGRKCVEENRETLESYVAFAQRMSQMHFQGIPILPLSYSSLLPLSQYRPEELPPHRLLFVGEERVLLSSLREHMQDFPSQNLWSPLSSREREESFASLCIAPPWKKRKQEGSLHMVALFHATDPRGVDCLQQYYTSALSLHDSSDFALWKRSSADSPYLFSHRGNFSSFWEVQREQRVDPSFPRMTEKGWKELIYQILFSRTEAEVILTLPCFPMGFSSPSTLSLHSFESLIPEKYFVQFSLLREECKNHLQKWSSRGDVEVFYRKGEKNFQELLSVESSSTVRLLCDFSLCKEFGAEEQQFHSSFSYLPVSLREMIWDHFQSTLPSPSSLTERSQVSSDYIS